MKLPKSLLDIFDHFKKDTIPLYEIGTTSLGFIHPNAEVGNNMSLTQAAQWPWSLWQPGREPGPKIYNTPL